MDANFDLDINNYTMNDLIQFFKLDENYTISDLLDKEAELVKQIVSVSSNNSEYTSKYKFDIVNFIKSGKEVLTSFRNEIETKKTMKKHEDKFYNADDRGRAPKIGKIINPLETQQALETSIIKPNNINGYGCDFITSIYVFNTSARNNFFTTSPASSTYELPLTWNNVVSIKLASANIPNVMYVFNDDAGTTQLYIEEDETGLAGLITIPEGNYSPFASCAMPLEESFSELLTAYINETLGTEKRFLVTINLFNRKVTISNTTYAFTMNTLIKDPPDFYSPYSNLSMDDYKNYTSDDLKAGLPILTYVQTMGYIMGFREVLYYNEKSYTSEAMFNNTYSDYIYFVLEDFTGSQTASNTYGILGQGILGKDILGVIPLNSSLFATTFDNNANFIYKQRDYFGPVDISRIAVKLMDQKGNEINLQGAEFNFSLEVKTLYNISKK